MRSSVARAARATEGNELAPSFHGSREMETDGKSVSRRCLVEAVDAYVGANNDVSRKLLADEVGQTQQQFSKSLSGIKGGDFNEVVDNIRAEIRLDYARRLADAEREGGLQALAAEALAHAAIHFLSTLRMKPKAAKAELR